MKDEIPLPESLTGLILLGVGLVDTSKQYIAMARRGRLLTKEKKVISELKIQIFSVYTENPLRQYSIFPHTQLIYIRADGEEGVSISSAKNP